VDIRQPVIAPGVTVGEAFMVEAEEMQDRGVEVVDMDSIANDRVAVIVGFPM
jgi:hypothetical protein